MYGGTGDDLLRLGVREPQFLPISAGRPFEFDGGPGFDTLDISRRGVEDPAFTLSGDDNVRGMERLDMAEPPRPIVLALDGRDAAGAVGCRARVRHRI
jgi:hypothetical protein